MKISETDLTAYDRDEKTVSAFKANILAIVLMAPVVLACFAVFVLAHGDSAGEINPWAFLVGLLFLIVLHELVHGAVWAHYCEDGWKSIKFGIIWKALTPYCHCSGVLALNHYRLGALAPLIVTGILPYLISLAIGNITLFCLSEFLIIGAGGDALILFMLRKEKKDVLLMDHPSLCGCIVYRPK